MVKKSRGAKGVFITGTDTGVGKTIVAAAIIRALMSKGIKVGAMKPIETGCKKRHGARGTGHGKLIPADGIFLREMAGMSDPLDLVVPARFEYPLAPMVASELEKRPVDPDKIAEAYAELSGKYDFMVVEGAGGLLVPIRNSEELRVMSNELKNKKDTKNSSRITHHASPYFMADLIKDLRLPMVVVARPALGTINHTFLTVEYAMRKGIEVLGVIINYSSPPGRSIAEKTNPEVLKKLCPAPVIGIVPYIKNITFKNIEKAAIRCIDFSVFFV